MSGEINISVLLRFMAEQARREITGTSGDLKTLGTAAGDAGRQAMSAGQSIDAAGTSLARSASEAANNAAQAGRSAVANAGLRDAVTGLTTATTGAIQPVNMMTSALGAQETAMQRAVAAYAGITGGAEGAFAAQLRHGMMLDELRAKYNPLFAVSRQYELELRDIAEAEKLGALGAAEAEAARQRAAAALRPMPGLIGQYGAATNQSSFYTANLFSQWNDIALMMAAGQNPFQLALQQGTQVSQVLMMMGGGTKALKAIGTSFLAMLNPISLGTIGIIGFGAAGVQWLTSLQGETRSFDDELKDLNSTLDRMRTNLNLLEDIRLEQKFGNMTAGVRELAQGMVELDRANELQQLRAMLEKGPEELTQESWTQWAKRSLGVGLTGASDSAGGRYSAQMQQEAMASNYAKLGAANSFADFQKRTAEINQLAAAGNIDGVIKKLADLGHAMSDGGSVTSMKKELMDLYVELSKTARKTAEVEALFNGTAHAAAVSHQTDQMVRGYTQQAELAQATVRHGENSSKIDEIRARHAREALRIKLEEMGADADGYDAMRARAALEIQLAADADVARQKRQKDQREYFDGLRREGELSDAILQYGAEAAEVEAVRARHAQEVLRARLQEKGWLPEMIASALALTEAEQQRQQAIKGANALRDSNEEIDRLRLEASLIGRTEQARRQSLAMYEAELDIRNRGLETGSALAEQLRQNAVLAADWRAEIDRVGDAWDRVTEAGERSIDSAIDRLTEGNWKEALSEVAQEWGDLYKDLAVKNPFKNALLGTDYATLSDVGGLGGIWDRLRGKTSGAQGMQAASMAVTTPMVTLNAGSIAGLGSLGFAQTGAATPAALSGSGNVQSQIWQFFAAKGLQPHQIAAILGNASAESAFNPLAMGDNGTSFGLFQHHGSRADGLLGAVGGMSGLGNIQAQLEYTWKELLTSENGVLKNLMASPNLYSATQAFAGFERPAGWSASNPTGSAGWQQRLAAAEAAMAKFSNTTGSATQGLSTFGTGLDSFGQTFSSGLQGLFKGTGGAGGGGFWSFFGSAAASAIGLPGFASGGDTPDGVIAVSNGEFYVPGAIAGRNRAMLAAINAGRPPAAGMISGPGSGTSDDILMPARGGDFIVNAAATSRHRDLLDAMVSGRPVQRLATGGPVLSRSPIPMPAAAAAAADGTGNLAGDSRPIIQIVNNSSAHVDAEVEETTDAQGRRTWRLTMADMVGDAISTPGGGARRRLAAMGVRPKGARR